MDVNHFTVSSFCLYNIMIFFHLNISQYFIFPIFLMPLHATKYKFYISNTTKVELSQLVDNYLSQHKSLLKNLK